MRETEGRMERDWEKKGREDEGGWRERMEGKDGGREREREVYRKRSEWRSQEIHRLYRHTFFTLGRGVPFFGCLCLLLSRYSSCI